MLYDALLRSETFRAAVKPGVRVLDIQAVADFYVSQGVKWEATRDDTTSKLPADVGTYAEYTFTESGEGGADHWTVGHLVRLIPAEWALPTLSKIATKPDDPPSAYRYFAQVDTFLKLRGTRRPADNPSKLPMGQPIHSANVYVLGFSEDGANVRSFMLVPKPAADGSMEVPFGFVRMFSTYEDKHYPLAFPAIPLTAFALLNGQVCGLVETNVDGRFRVAFEQPPGTTASDVVT